jgi:hypothetical protein
LIDKKVLTPYGYLMEGGNPSGILKDIFAYYTIQQVMLGEKCAIEDNRYGVLVNLREIKDRYS